MRSRYLCTRRYPSHLDVLFFPLGKSFGYRRLVSLAVAPLCDTRARDPDAGCDRDGESGTASGALPVRPSPSPVGGRPMPAGASWLAAGAIALIPCGYAGDMSARWPPRQPANHRRDLDPSARAWALGFALSQRASALVQRCPSRPAHLAYRWAQHPSLSLPPVPVSLR